jgi:hypothetical protein
MKTEYIVRGTTPHGESKTVYIVKEGDRWFGRFGRFESPNFDDPVAAIDKSIAVLQKEGCTQFQVVTNAFRRFVGFRRSSCS